MVAKRYADISVKTDKMAKVRLLIPNFVRKETCGVSPVSSFLFVAI